MTSPKPNTHLCHNPACRKPVHRRDAYLRSVSLTQVAFCSPACVALFDGLDKAARTGVERRTSAVVR